MALVKVIMPVIGFLMFSYISYFAVFAIESGTNTWIEGTPMRVPRFEMSVADINGKIYAIGGVDINEYLTQTSEIYDPKLDQWSTAPPIPEPVDHAGVASYGGRMYVVGGFGENNAVTDSLYIYDDLLKIKN